MSEEEYESPYCEVCGTCGYLGCCGIRNFIEEHIKGKTNCKNEEIIINELIDLVEYEEDKDKEIERLTNLCNKYEEEHKTTFETWKKDIKVLTELEKFIVIESSTLGIIGKDKLLDKLKELKQGGSNESNRLIK